VTLLPDRFRLAPFLTASVVALVAFLAVGGNAAAAFPGRAGPIAFESTRAGGLSIWLVGPNGDGLRQFTPGGGGDRRPRFRQYAPASAPDGRHIAYVGSKEAGDRTWSNLFVKGVGVRGLNQPGRRVLRQATPRRIDSVAFAPGGRRLVFSAQPRRGDPDLELFSVRLGGAGLRQLTHNQVQDIEPNVSRSGLVAFTRLYLRGRPPVALFGPSNIALIRPSSGGSRLLTFAARSGGEDRSPSFAPRGNWVVHERSFPDSSSSGQINEAQLSSHRSRTLFVGDPERGGFDEPHNPAYSPAGDSVVFDRTIRDEAGQITNPDLYVVGRDRKGLRYLTGLEGEYDTDPDWAPAR